MRLLRFDDIAVVSSGRGTACPEDQGAEGAKGYDIEDVAGTENRFRPDDDPGVGEYVGACNAVPRVLVQDVAGEDGGPVALHHPPPVDKLQHPFFTLHHTHLF